MEQRSVKDLHSRLTPTGPHRATTYHPASIRFHLSSFIPEMAARLCLG